MSRDVESVDEDASLRRAGSSRRESSAHTDDGHDQLPTPECFPPPHVLDTPIVRKSLPRATSVARSHLMSMQLTSGGSGASPEIKVRAKIIV